VSVTASTTLASFFDDIVDVISDGSTSFQNARAFVVDKLRLQSSAVPCFQIEPISLQTIGEQSGMNAMVLEYKIHAVVKVEMDYGKQPSQRLISDSIRSGEDLPKGAFPMALAIADRLRVMQGVGSGYDAQVLLRVEGGASDDLEGLTSAYAHFRTMIRINGDG
jgi:hypothetical protein